MKRSKRSKRIKIKKGTKAKFWKAFSEYIRFKDADENGMVKCISCPKVMHWKDADAGHWRPKSLGLAFYFYEKNVQNQCQTCNLFLQGNQHEYAKALIKKYGEDVLEEIDALRRTPRKISKVEYYELTQEYKAKLSDLLKKRLDIKALDISGQL